MPTVLPICQQYMAVASPQPPPLLQLPQQYSRTAVVACGVAKKRNPIREVGADVLPDGKPNTPWRRIKLRIQTAVSPQVCGRGGCCMCNTPLCVALCVLRAAWWEG
jgi:hypothetical protein